MPQDELSRQIANAYAADGAAGPTPKVTAPQAVPKWTPLTASYEATPQPKEEPEEKGFFESLWEIWDAGAGLANGIARTAEHFFQNEDEEMGVTDWKKFKKYTEESSLLDDEERSKKMRELIDQGIVNQEVYSEYNEKAVEEEKKKLAENDEVAIASEAWRKFKEELIASLKEQEIISSMNSPEAKLLLSSLDEVVADYVINRTNIEKSRGSVVYDTLSSRLETEWKWKVTQAVSSWARNIDAGDNDAEAYSKTVEQNLELAKEIDTINAGISFASQGAALEKYWNRLQSGKGNVILNATGAIASTIGLVLDGAVEIARLWILSTKPTRAIGEVFGIGFDTLDELQHADKSRLISNFREVWENAPEIFMGLPIFRAGQAVEGIASLKNVASISKTINDGGRLSRPLAIADSFIANLTADTIVYDGAIQGLMGQALSPTENAQNFGLNILFNGAIASLAKKGNAATAEMLTTGAMPDAPNIASAREFGVTSEEIQALKTGEIQKAQALMADRMINNASYASKTEGVTDISQLPSTLRENIRGTFEAVKTVVERAANGTATAGDTQLIFSSVLRGGKKLSEKDVNSITGFATVASFTETELQKGNPDFLAKYNLIYLNGKKQEMGKGNFPVDSIISAGNKFVNSRTDSDVYRQAGNLFVAMLTGAEKPVIQAGRQAQVTRALRDVSQHVINEVFVKGGLMSEGERLYGVLQKNADNTFLNVRTGEILDASAAVDFAKNFTAKKEGGSFNEAINVPVSSGNASIDAFLLKRSGAKTLEEITLPLKTALSKETIEKMDEPTFRAFQFTLAKEVIAEITSKGKEVTPARFNAHKIFRIWGKSADGTYNLGMGTLAVPGIDVKTLASRIRSSLLTSQPKDFLRNFSKTVDGLDYIRNADSLQDKHRTEIMENATKSEEWETAAAVFDGLDVLKTVTEDGIRADSIQEFSMEKAYLDAKLSLEKNSAVPTYRSEEESLLATAPGRKAPFSEKKWKEGITSDGWKRLYDTAEYTSPTERTATSFFTATRFDELSSTEQKTLASINIPDDAKTHLKINFKSGVTGMIDSGIKAWNEQLIKAIESVESSKNEALYFLQPTVVDGQFASEWVKVSDLKTIQIWNKAAGGLRPIPVTFRSSHIPAFAILYDSGKLKTAQLGIDYYSPTGESLKNFSVKKGEEFKRENTHHSFKIVERLGKTSPEVLLPSKLLSSMDEKFLPFFKEFWLKYQTTPNGKRLAASIVPTTKQEKETLSLFKSGRPTGPIASGEYISESATLRLLDNEDAEVFLHEFSHHLWEFLSKDKQEEILLIKNQFFPEYGQDVYEFFANYLSAAFIRKNDSFAKDDIFSRITPDKFASTTEYIGAIIKAAFEKFTLFVKTQLGLTEKDVVTSATDTYFESLLEAYRLGEQNRLSPSAIVKKFLLASGLKYPQIIDAIGTVYQTMLKDSAVKAKIDSLSPELRPVVTEHILNVGIRKVLWEEQPQIFAQFNDWVKTLTGVSELIGTHKTKEFPKEVTLALNRSKEITRSLIAASTSPEKTISFIQLYKAVTDAQKNPPQPVIVSRVSQTLNAGINKNVQTTIVDEDVRPKVLAEKLLDLWRYTQYGKFNNRAQVGTEGPFVNAVNSSMEHIRGQLLNARGNVINKSRTIQQAIDFSLLNIDQKQKELIEIFSVYARDEINLPVIDEALKELSFYKARIKDLLNGTLQKEGLEFETTRLKELKATLAAKKDEHAQILLRLQEASSSVRVISEKVSAFTLMKESLEGTIKKETARIKELSNQNPVLIRNAFRAYISKLEVSKAVPRFALLKDMMLNPSEKRLLSQLKAVDPKSGEVLERKTVLVDDTYSQGDVLNGGQWYKTDTKAVAFQPLSLFDGEKLLETTDSLIVIPQELLIKIFSDISPTEKTKRIKSFILGNIERVETLPGRFLFDGKNTVFNQQAKELLSGYKTKKYIAEDKTVEDLTRQLNYSFRYTPGTGVSLYGSSSPLRHSVESLALFVNPKAYDAIGNGQELPELKAIQNTVAIAKDLLSGAEPKYIRGDYLYSHLSSFGAYGTYFRNFLNSNPAIRAASDSLFNINDFTIGEWIKGSSASQGYADKVDLFAAKIAFQKILSAIPGQENALVQFNKWVTHSGIVESNIAYRLKDDNYVLHAVADILYDIFSLPKTVERSEVIGYLKAQARADAKGFASLFSIVRDIFEVRVRKNQLIIDSGRYVPQTTRTVFGENKRGVDTYSEGISGDYEQEVGGIIKKVMEGMMNKAAAAEKVEGIEELLSKYSEDRYAIDGPASGEYFMNALSQVLTHHVEEVKADLLFDGPLRVDSSPDIPLELTSNIQLVMHSEEVGRGRILSNLKSKDETWGKQYAALARELGGKSPLAKEAIYKQQELISKKRSAVKQFKNFTQLSPDQDLYTDVLRIYDTTDELIPNPSTGAMRIGEFDIIPSIPRETQALLKKYDIFNGSAEKDGTFGDPMQFIQYVIDVGMKTNYGPGLSPQELSKIKSTIKTTDVGEFGEVSVDTVFEPTTIPVFQVQFKRDGKVVRTLPYTLSQFHRFPLVQKYLKDNALPTYFGPFDTMGVILEHLYKRSNLGTSLLDEGMKGKTTFKTLSVSESQTLKKIKAFFDKAFGREDEVVKKKEKEFFETEDSIVKTEFEIHEGNKQALRARVANNIDTAQEALSKAKTPEEKAAAEESLDIAIQELTDFDETLERIERQLSLNSSISETKRAVEATKLQVAAAKRALEGAISKREGVKEAREKLEFISSELTQAQELLTKRQKEKDSLLNEIGDTICEMPNS